MSFNYGFAFSESNNMEFRVDIKQNGSVVKTFTVNDASEKAKAYSRTETINVSGDFSIEFTNLSPSSSADKNKDRVAIWNVSWTNY